MSNSPSRGLSNKARKNKRKSAETNKKQKDMRRTIRQHELFKNIKPKQKYIFYSDYFEIDGKYATILTVMHNNDSDDGMGYFWGINLIPRNIDPKVTIRKIEHVKRMPESWVETHQGRAEGLLNNQAGETERDGSLTARQRLSKRQQGLLDIANDLMNGSSYLRVAFRLFVKAPTLELLDDTVNKINRQYKDRFDTVFATPYVGEQRREMSALLGKVDNKMGKNFMFTSAEFSGSYSLVTRGIEDPRGEYIGQMEGDVNNSAVLMDIDNYESHVVIAGDKKAASLSQWDFKGERGSDIWGIKLGMNALLRNKRVVHLVLNRSNVAGIGVPLPEITAKVDMTRGDINPFEMFGRPEDEMSIFPAHIEKMRLMVEQLSPEDDTHRKSRIGGALSELLTQFYVDRNMWRHNAQHNRDQIRIVGVPHEDVPKLNVFATYVEQAHKAQIEANKHDPETLSAYGRLREIFRDMLSNNNDLFETTTSSVIDEAAVSHRVIYDFSSLIKRGRGLMMAQFVNALSYAVGSLEEGDLVVLHGAEYLTAPIRQYVRDQFDTLGSHGVRVAFIYGSIDSMLNDVDLNQFDRADYTILGGMTKTDIEKYQKLMVEEVPVSLRSLLEHKERHRFYLRRGFDNIVFASDIQMGMDHQT